MNLPQPPMSLEKAIARMEGYYISGSRPNRNNNPGDIEWGQFAMTHGAINNDGRFAIFPDETSGFYALTELLKFHYAGMTVEQAINKYAPPTENNTVNYVKVICEWCNCDPDTVIDGLIGD